MELWSLRPRVWIKWLKSDPNNVQYKWILSTLHCYFAHVCATQQFAGQFKIIAIRYRARAAVPALGSRHVAKLPCDITSALDRNSLMQMRSNTSSACYCSQEQHHYHYVIMFTRTHHASPFKLITSMTFMDLLWTSCGVCHTKSAFNLPSSKMPTSTCTSGGIPPQFSYGIRVEFGISPSLGEKRSASAARSLRWFSWMKLSTSASAEAALKPAQSSNDVIFKSLEQTLRLRLEMCPLFQN